jgi:hypothetical protein
MRQIGARQEAARVGGISSSGRELCCTTWITDFRTVSTSAARYQQLSLNPQKLAGQCGKLKCCLNYELDMYLEGLKSFPSTNVKLKLEGSEAFHVKTDIFKKIMWYAVSGSGSLVGISPEKVSEIIALNKKGELIKDIKAYEIVTSSAVSSEDGISQEISGFSSLEDESFNRLAKQLTNSSNKNKNHSKNRNQQTNNNNREERSNNNQRQAQHNSSKEQPKPQENIARSNELKTKNSDDNSNEAVAKKRRNNHRRRNHSKGKPNDSNQAN